MNKFYCKVREHVSTSYTLALHVLPRRWRIYEMHLCADESIAQNGIFQCDYGLFGGRALKRCGAQTRPEELPAKIRARMQEIIQEHERMFEK